MMITVRNAQPLDEEAVFFLARDMATSFQVDRIGFSKCFTRILSSSHLHLSVAESSGDVIGYVYGTVHPAFYASGNVSWVEEITVRESFRKKGTGRLLMDNFEAWASANGCKLVGLATRRASAFYLSLGYEESATYFRKIL